MTISVEGDEESGYWVNLGPGCLRLTAIYATPEQPGAMLAYYHRIYHLKPAGACAKMVLPTSEEPSGYQHRHPLLNTVRRLAGKRAQRHLDLRADLYHEFESTSASLVEREDA